MTPRSATAAMASGDLLAGGLGRLRRLGGVGRRRGRGPALVARRSQRLVAAPGFGTAPRLVAATRGGRGRVGRGTALVARRRRGGGGGLGRRGPLPAVGPVEAGSLEHDPDRREDLAQPAAAILVDGQRIVGELLHRLELATALGAKVLVSGHGFLPGGTKIR